MKPFLRHVPESVHTCRPTQDGQWMIITRTGKVASSPAELPEGARVRINGGLAKRVGA